MNKDDTAYLRDMRDHAQKLRRVATHVTRTDYDTDETLQAACRYWIQVIGEAAQHVSEPFQVAHPAIPWRLIIGMRNRIVHDYLGIDDDMVWEVVTRNSAALLQELNAILPD